MPQNERASMNKIRCFAGVPVLIGGALCVYFSAAATPQTTGTQTQAVVTATTVFLNSLTPDQRQKILFPFTPQKSATVARFARSGRGPGGNGGRAGGPPNGTSDNGGQFGRGPGDGRGPGGGGPGGGTGRGPGGGFGGFTGEQYGQAVWSNFPVSDVPRPGVNLGSLSTAQRDAAMHMMQIVLSPKGYQKVQEIMGSDQALSDGGTPFSSGINAYTIGIFGQPSVTSPWMLEYGGHHLALNITMAGERSVITPTLTGAQPAIYTSNGKTVRALAEENDKAFVLLDALDEAQREQAILNYQIGDLVLGPGHSGETIQPEGLKASAMNENQRALLLDVIAEWAGIVNDVYMNPRMAEIKAGLADTYFAWSGPTTHAPDKNGSAYYRIQGPRLVIEFSPQGGGDSTMHVHTIYRDPTNDYGVKFTGAQ
jgi:hypothetical protein